MGFRLRLREGRFCAGKAEVRAWDDMWVAEGGWVPASARTQEGEEFPPSSSRGQALCGNNEGGGGRDDMWVTEGGWVPASARTQEGEEFPPPSARGQVLCGNNGGGGGRDDMWVTEGGWVPASARTQEGEEFPPPSPRGQAMREDTGGGGFHPHPCLPPQGGRAVREPSLQRGGGGRKRLAVTSTVLGLHPGQNVPDLRQQLVGNGRRCSEGSGGGRRFDDALQHQLALAKDRVPEGNGVNHTYEVSLAAGVLPRLARRLDLQAPYSAETHPRVVVQTHVRHTVQRNGGFFSEENPFVYLD